MLIVGSSFSVSARLVKDWAPMDLTAAVTVAMKYVGPDGRKGSWPGSVVSAPNGTMKADVPAAANDVSGEYKVWAEVDFGGGNVVRTASETFFVFKEGEGQI